MATSRSMDNVTEQFIVEMSPMKNYEPFRKTIKNLFQSTYFTHAAYWKGTIKQSLIVAHPKVIKSEPDSLCIGRRAKIYLQLRNGLLFGFELSGDVDQAITMLPFIATWLTNKEYDVDQFSDYESQLLMVLNNVRPSDMLEIDLTELSKHSQFCAIRFFRNAPVLLNAIFFEGALNQLTHSLLAIVQNKCGAAELKFLQATVRTFLNDFFNVKQLTDDFNNDLDPTIIGLLNEITAKNQDLFDQLNDLMVVNKDSHFDARRAIERFSCLNSYNYLVAGNTETRNNRRVTMLQSPRLFHWVARANLSQAKWSTLFDPRWLLLDSSQESYRRSILTQIDRGAPLPLNCRISESPIAVHRSHEITLVPSNRASEHVEPVGRSGKVSSAILAVHEDVSNEFELYDKAVEIVRRSRRGSVSLVQRNLRIGYSRASMLLEQMEKDGIVGPIGEDGCRVVLS